MNRTKDKRRVGCCGRGWRLLLLAAVVVFGIILCGGLKACEVTDVWLYVGETEDDVLENDDTTLTLCEGATEYWFRVVWKHRDDREEWGGDNPFHVAVYDLTASVTLWEDEDIEDEDEPDRYKMQKVKEVNSPPSALTAGSHTLEAWAIRKWIGEWVPSNHCTVTVRASDLGCAPKVGHKDTSLVCVDELLGSGKGCPKTGTHRWDCDHGTNGCDHEERYCVVASIAVLAAHFGGNLSQDRISYKVFASLHSGPDCDLGHNILWLGGNIVPTLSWALNGAGITEDTTPTFTEIKDHLCGGRPMLADHPIGGPQYHTVVIDGWHTSGNDNYIHVLDPATGTETNKKWGDYAINRIYVPPAYATGRSDEASVSTDTDGDGLMDFDEINRFSGSPYNFSHTDADSDNDGKNDKDELADIVFGP